MLKHLLPLSLVGMLCLAPAGANDIAQHITESRTLAQEFMKSLKRELKLGMQAGGPVYAIGVCHVNAPSIAAQMSEDTGWDIGRTSLRIRNPGNSPDAWERHVLETFEERLLAGEKAAEIEHFEVVKEDGDRVFRYMKAIPTAEVCVTCHGRVLDKTVKERLRDLYPMDQARGYRPGDIRGAFTFAKTLSHPLE